MAGITAAAFYIPKYRLSCAQIAAMWGTRPVGGQKAVAGYDEDAVTMAAAAVRRCMSRTGRSARGLYFSSTTAPYKEKQNAAIIAGVAELHRNSITADFTNSLRSATTAIKSALDAVKGRTGKTVMVVASDCRAGAPKGRLEQILGDGAAALAIGTEEVIAEIEGCHCVFSDFTDQWRTDADRFVKSAEGRFIDDEGYGPIMQDAIGAIMKTHDLQPRDFSKIVLSASDARQHAGLAKKLGFEPSQVQDHLFSMIGNTGTAAALIMLIAALEQARPGERILVANYGDGADALIVRATEAITRHQRQPPLKDRLASNRSIDYGTYLAWRDLVPFEASSLPERSEPSIAGRWRQRQTISSLAGVKCRKCGLAQIHPIGQKVRVCVSCQTKDDFDPYSFSDKTGRLFTYAVDELQPTSNPPGLNGVVDFDGGGRLMCELTDYDIDRVRIGMEVEMTFRKMSRGKGIVNYFWKARPVE